MVVNNIYVATLFATHLSKMYVNIYEVMAPDAGFEPATK